MKDLNHPATRVFYSLHIATLVAVAISALFFFNFTAEDSYITYRYAENWVTRGALVYNDGEPINAMTSPLHAMVSAGLFFVTGNTVVGNKIFSAILVLIASFLVWYRYRQQLHLQVLALLLLLPPSVLLWTFGGLETPILLFLVTTAVILTGQDSTFKPALLLVILVLAGLAFLTRYDSVLFFLPVALYIISRTRSVKYVVLAIVAASILPLLWLLISLNYYGDLLPTSFYVKTPKGGLGDLMFNGAYISLYLLFIGVIPSMVVSCIILGSPKKVMDVLYRHFKSCWWLYAGLVLEILYGLTMATHHMMFSFRFFVPYIPATVILVVDLLRHATEARGLDLSRGKPAYMFSGFLLLLMLFQVYQGAYTYNRSVNGLSFIGEYRALGIRDYGEFIQILKQEAGDIETHWAKTGNESDRQPRILTYAAGMLPYAYRDSYIYEKLVSYRHCHERYRQGLYADYIHIVAPRQGQVDEQLPLPEDHYELVSAYEFFFDGSMQNFLVYYNPTPEGHNLSAGISDLCSQNLDE